MTNITKLEFMTLDLLGKNYIPWILDIEIHLDAIGFGDTIEEGNNESMQCCLNFLYYNLHEWLKFEYPIVKDSLVLSKILKERYDH